MRLSSVVLAVVLLVSVVGLIGSLRTEGFQAVIADTPTSVGGFQSFYYSYATTKTTYSVAQFVIPVNDTAPMIVHVHNQPDVSMCCGDSNLIEVAPTVTYPVIQSTWLILTFAAIVGGLILFVFVKERESQVENREVV